MTLSRRDLLKIGAGASAAVALGVRPGFGRGPSVPLDLILRPIPSTGEKIPVVGIGTSRRYDVGASAAERDPLRETLSVFRELGGTLIDTAPSYGNAEVVVGDLVSELGFRDDLFFATKVRTEGREEGNAEIARSFERLRTDRFDLLQVHNLVDTETQLATLREMKDAGTIRYLGITTSSGRQYAQFADVMRREELDFIQVNYSLASRDAADVILPLAADRGMAVLVNVPFGRGRLFDAVGERPLPDWAGEFDCESWGQFFLKYIVGHPAVTCVIPGTAKPHYATDNMGAAMGRLPDAAMRAKMEEFFDSLT
ncbi:MAG: aldo/keto reductase [Gemmatimonadota bacterium]|jgi:aryl-alcohol dehydrogenase-like predicted oxidoreductase